MTYLGINIGGTTCSVSLGDVNCAILRQEAFPTGPVRDVLARLAELAARFKASDTVAVGISCGGPLDSAKGLVLSPPNLPGWDRIPICARMTEVTGLPAYLMNDANAGGLAEWYLGTNGTCDALVFLTCGTGMGSGIVLNGKVFEGVNGNAGEVGHLRLTPEGPVGYRKAGSFEGWCSGGGFKQYAGWTPKEAAEAARKGDRKAIADFELFGRKLGEGLAMVIDILNPRRIAIGGIYMRCEEFIAPAMRGVLKDEALPLSLEVCEIVKAVTGEQIGDYSALSVAKYSHRV